MDSRNALSRSRCRERRLKSIACNFMSCNFMHCNFDGPSFSCPSFSVNPISLMTQCDFGIPQCSVFGPLLYCLRVSRWRADRVVQRVIQPVRRRHAAFRQPAWQHQRHASHRQARSLFGRSSFLVPAERPPAVYADKSEVVFLGSPAQLRSAANIFDVATSTLSVASKLKSLCVTIDSNLRFDCHARKVAKAYNFHTRTLRHAHSLLTDDVAQTVACSIITSMLD